MDLYVILLTDNSSIWLQAVIMGLLLVTGGAAAGLMVDACVRFFNMLAGR
ncbi:MAG TPA: hypothetical protein VFD03_04395 [Clostridia bacterium]|nr:hypothetical protein [Clostridia bacterium]